MKEWFGTIGKFSMRDSTLRGLGLYRYDLEKGAFTEESGAACGWNIGCQCYDPARGILYVTDESRGGLTMPGGRLAAFELQAKERRLKLLDTIPSYAANPSYLCMSRQRNFLIVVHHTTDQSVVRLRRSADCALQSELLFDDCLILLAELEADGRFAGVCDLVRVEGEICDGVYCQPHLHAVVPSPSGRQFAVCDKGLHRLYVYTLDEAEKKLRRTACEQMPGKAEPRYACFHPEKPFLFVNFENESVLACYRLDAKNGQISLLDVCRFAEDAPGINPMIGDLCVDTQGAFLYLSARSTNRLYVLKIETGGTLCVRQQLSCGGVNPRGLCLSPDGRFLFVANSDSGGIERFERLEDGTLRPSGCVARCPAPGNLQIFCREMEEK